MKGNHKNEEKRAKQEVLTAIKYTGREVSTVFWNDTTLRKDKSRTYADMVVTGKE